jgi:hypothetical protein
MRGARVTMMTAPRGPARDASATTATRCRNLHTGSLDVDQPALTGTMPSRRVRAVR